MTDELVRLGVLAKLAGADAVGGQLQQIGHVLAAFEFDHALDYASERAEDAVFVGALRIAVVGERDYEVVTRASALGMVSVATV